MNKEESFEEFREKNYKSFTELAKDPARVAWNHQAKKIEALEKEIAKLQTSSSASLEAKEASEMRTAQLIAALKKAEGAMFGACDKSLTVPEDIKEYRDSPEYQAIKHLLKED